MIYIVMGVSGCGKTTVGKVLAERLGLAFFDADDFHSETNVRKMKDGVPLNDDDRLPWLVDLSRRIPKWDANGGAVLACSALTRKYREILTSNHDCRCRFINLSVDYSLAVSRRETMNGHFFPASLLTSQFDLLEVFGDIISIANDRLPEDTCAEILRLVK